MLSAQELFCLMAILTPIIMPKKIHFNTLVRHIAGGDREKTGDTEPSPVSSGTVPPNSALRGVRVRCQTAGAECCIRGPGARE